MDFFKKKYNTNSKFFTIVFYIILFAFLLSYIKSIDFKQIELIRINPLYLLLAVIFGLIARLWYAKVWSNLLSIFTNIDTAIHGKEILNIFAKSYITRYIPGTIPWVAMRISLTSRLNLKKTKLASITIFETLSQIITFLFVSIIIFLCQNRHYFNYDLTPFIWTSLFCVLFGLLILYINRKTKKLINFSIPISKKSLLYSFSMSLISFLITGTYFLFNILTITGIGNINDVIYYLGVSGLSISVGMLSFFAPGGIGVRDSIQLVLLSTTLKMEYAIGIVVICRIVDVICDLLFILIPTIINRRNDNTNVSL